MKYVCDDFGLHPSIDKAILHLAELGAVDAVSIMVNPGLEGELTANSQLANVEVGLHLNLTEGQPVTTDCTKLTQNNGNFFGLKTFMTNSVRGNVDSFELEQEISAQIHRLQSVFERVDHVDGHQHIQYFPPVRRALRKVLLEEDLGHIRIRSGFLRGLSPRSLILNSFALTDFSKSHFPFLVDYSNRNIEPHEGTEIMMHVACPQLQADELNLTSYSWKQRVEQYQRRLTEIGEQC